jgi:hypothetical protein
MNQRYLKNVREKNRRNAMRGKKLYKTIMGTYRED